MKTKCNGRVYSIGKFVGLHRNYFVQLQEADDYVNLQLPTKHSRVGFLIDNTSNSNQDMCAAIASFCIRTKNMCADFEGGVEFLLPVFPYAKHQNERGNDASNR